MKSQKVFVGMSGGVDSSLTAALLVEQGFDVTGVYMKNWSQNLPGMRCPWADDLADAKRVAVHLGIDFKVYDFETEYREKVVEYMLDEYQKGRTPNPDIMCNQEVKFKLFLKTALEDGADLIATGHYARTRAGKLLMARDQAKDQTYFLYRVSSRALEKTLFPLGGFLKSEVRQMALERDLVTARKKESMGICFVGQVGIREFLSEFVETSPGKIIDKKTGQVLGWHDGAIFYTLGQRHGLDVSGDLPFYVAGKDISKNEVYVSSDLNVDGLWQKELVLKDLHSISGKKIAGGVLKARVRHQASLTEVDFCQISEKESLVKFETPIRAATSGQSVVLYDGEVCLGGGIIA